MRTVAFVVLLTSAPATSLATGFWGLGNSPDGTFVATRIDTQGEIISGYIESATGRRAAMTVAPRMQYPQLRPWLVPMPSEVVGGSAAYFAEREFGGSWGTAVTATGREAFHSLDGGTTAELLGDLEGGTVDSAALGQGVGYCTSALGREACLFGGLASPTGLGDLAGGEYDSMANATNRREVVGRATSAQGQEAFLWTNQSGMLGLGDLPGGSFESEAFDIDNAGVFVVGTGTSADGVEAFRWSGKTGMIGIGDLPGGAFASAARAVSAAGYWIVGQGTTERGQEAFVWSEQEGMRSLRDVLATSPELLSALEGWTLVDAVSCIKENGEGAEFFILGNGINPLGQREAWVAEIPEPSACLLVLTGLAGFGAHRRLHAYRRSARWGGCPRS